MFSKLIASLQKWSGVLALFLVLTGGVAYAADTIGSADVIDNSLLSVDLKNGQGVRGADVVNGSLTGADITDGQIVNADLANGAVNSASVTDNSLTADDLAADSVGASELQAGVVSNSKLATSAVDSAKVANNSLTTADIAGTDVNGGLINLSAGSVANGRCKQFDSPVGGAKAGEAVLYSAQGALQDGIMLYGQRVPSDGHVTLDVCNFSGTTQDEITNLPVRVITFG